MTVIDLNLNEKRIKEEKIKEVILEDLEDAEVNEEEQITPEEQRQLDRYAAFMKSLKSVGLDAMDANVRGETPPTVDWSFIKLLNLIQLSIIVVSKMTKPK